MKTHKAALHEALDDYDPAVEKLALGRLLSGKQLYDYKSHRLHLFVRDEIQARAILLRAEALAIESGRKLRLRYLEKRLLNKVASAALGSVK